MISWRGSMLTALVATLGRPEWWVMALAGFLVRGGLLIVLLPIVVIPSPAALATAFAPTIEGFVFGGPTPERSLLVLGMVATVVATIGLAGLAGSWLDLAQLREAAEDEELDLRWVAVDASARDSLALRLAAHLPTLLVAGYAAVRIVDAAYAELISPAGADPIAARVVARVPEALGLLAITWLLGETIGGLAARRAAAGAGIRTSFAHALRQLLTLRGLATFAGTTAGVAAAISLFLFAAARSWDHLRNLLLGAADPLAVGAALLVFVGSWVLGLATLALVLAWRGAAWTAEVAPRGAPETHPRQAPMPEPLQG